MDKYLYNGIELPALPVWDKETYPCAYIIQNPTAGESWFYGFWHTTLPLTMKDEKTVSSTHNDFVGGVLYAYAEDTNSWELYDDTYAPIKGYTYVVAVPLWTNTTMLYEDGTLYLAASDPVPVLSLTERDLYRKINGQSTKLTLYKKVGGELVALDEYTQGGNL
jgi:hypothetical protein